MPDRPLLLFPAPEAADRTKGTGFPGHVHKPSHSRQGQRLSPIFQQLQEAFNARRVEMQQTTSGTDPEQVLVIETIDSVEDFANAVKRIDGLEWMGEIDIEEISPDQDFYDEKDHAKALKGRLYLVMTNQRALDEMLSLWQQYQNDPNMTFGRGLTRFRNVFLHLKDIRRWGVQDRIEETGVLDAWREDLTHDGDRSVKFEVELWFRKTEPRRTEARQQLKSLIEGLGGTILDDCLIAEIAYHGLLAEIPANAAQSIIEHPEVDLIKCDSVMFFRPVGQMATSKQPQEGELSDQAPLEASLPTGNPIVAVLDGLPLANHDLLQDRLIIDDPDDCASAYTVSDRIHGTATASLLVHGDLNDGTPPLTTPVYVRPIMKPVPWYDTPRPERIPEDVLVVDYIHRVVRRIFEGEGTSEAVAPTVRIINFSIGDPSRQFTQVLSPLARLLDWLSDRYKVLFVVSAGNHTHDIETSISSTDFDTFAPSSKEAEIVKALYGDARHRSILSPSESINAITVGALHFDTATAGPTERGIDLFESLLPSPVSAFGSGYRKAIKPDLVFNGGRVLYTSPLITSPNAKFEFRKLRIPPGNKVASPSNAPGDLSKVAHSCGTSNASALTSRLAVACHDTIREIFEEQAPGIELESYLVPLLKTMIIHGCSQGEIGQRLQTILQTPQNGHHIKSWVSRWLGYGVPNSERVLACTEQRATLLGVGQLADGEGHLFSLPLPPSLGARRDRRRLTVTLAWLSPVVPTTQKYRSTSLWFEVPNGNLAPNRQEADWRAVRRGTVQHEIFEGEQAIPITEDANLTIKVNCKKDAGRIRHPIHYGLAVTLEVAEGIDVPIYEEIRTRIASLIEIRAREGR